MYKKYRDAELKICSSSGAKLVPCGLLFEEE
jgi:hypothetical protein